MMNILAIITNMLLLYVPMPIEIPINKVLVIGTCLSRLNGHFIQKFEVDCIKDGNSISYRTPERYVHVYKINSSNTKQGLKNEINAIGNFNVVIIYTSELLSNKIYNWIKYILPDARIVTIVYGQEIKLLEIDL